MPSIERVIDDLEIEIVSRNGEEAMALCPFHQDSSPSFSINTKRGIWNCFSGCGSGNFDQLLERLDAGHIQYDKVALEERRRKVERELPPVFDVTEWPKANDNPFLRRKFVGQDEIDKWNIRLSAVGFAIQIYDIDNNPVGHVERFIELGQAGNKYRYSRGFPKSRHLFGIQHYDFNEEKFAVLVEGIFDVVNMHRIGVTCTLGIMGTSISNFQIQLLKNLQIEKIMVVMDNDEPGLKGALKVAYDLAEDFEVYLPEWTLYAFADPGEFPSIKAFRPMSKSRIFVNRLKLNRFKLSLTGGKEWHQVVSQEA